MRRSFNTQLLRCIALPFSTSLTAVTFSVFYIASSAIAQTPEMIVPAMQAPLMNESSGGGSKNASSGMFKSSSSTPAPLISIKNSESGEETGKNNQTSDKKSNSNSEDASFDELKENVRNKKQLEKKIPNEFQKFTEQSLGYQLPIFGQTLFDEQNISFSSSQSIAPPSDYLLGIGDEITIRATGSLDIDYRTTIDKNGAISLPRIGTFNIAGLNHAEAQHTIQRQIARFYKDFTLYVSLGKLRSIRVYLVGHVQRPGAYTVSSLSTLVNTLLQGGGPSSVGSLRHIQVKRAGKLITDFDLYDLLLKGDKSKDIRLMAEDVIYVAPIGQLIALTGSVHQPAIYEVREQETLANVLNFAGGISAVASTDSVSIERIINRNQRTVKRFPLTQKNLMQPVKEGDLITVSNISRKFDRVVSVRGHVASPARLPWRANMRITDVIPSKEALITPDYYEAMEKYLIPLMVPKDDSKKNPKGREEAFNSRDEKLNTIEMIPSKTEIKPLLQEPNLEYAVIERLKDDLSHEIIPFNLGKALAGDEQNNLWLKPNDVITVFSKNDINVPRAQRTGLVRLDGEFKASGIYRIKQGESLKQLIERIGGITPDAQLYALEVERESVKQKQISRYDEWLSRMERDLMRKESSQNALSAEDATVKKAELETRKQLFQRLRGIKPSGRIVLNFKNNYSPTLSDLPDLILEEGDKISLPARASTVSVIGAVVNDGNFLYREGKSAKDYLEDSGGTTDYADSSNLYIIRADGSITGSSQRSFFGLFSNSAFLVQPGDTIVLPEKTGGQSFLSMLKDFSTVFYQLGLGAAAIQVLRK
ncbi:MAG: SLBB domain-containing protein [Pseudomonadota bacterium]